MSEPVGKWLRADESPSASGKTSIWRLTPVDATLPIGEVAWYGPWRRYVFRPDPDTVYEQDCLRALADFCERKTREHRERAARRKREGVGHERLGTHLVPR